MKSNQLRPDSGNFEPCDLQESLRPLGIREIAERMEVSPLIMDQGDLSREALIQDQDASICCTCKIPWEDLEDKGIPHPTVEGPMGAGTANGGLVSGPIWPY